MKVLLTDYINWFSVNHVISDLDKRVNGIIVADLGADYLVLKEEVNE